MYIAFAYLDISVGGLFSLEYLTGPMEGEASWMGWSWGRFVNMLSHLWIPAIVLGTAGTASLIRIMRNNLLDELGKAYVVTARSKGLKNWRVILKYPVRVAINPLISGIGALLPGLVGGSVIVSVVLSLPTMGPLLLRALLGQDMYLAGTIILLLGILTIIGTLISDIMLVLVDPRINLTEVAD
jgi:peptide/nickel transport system permease protein